MNIVLIPGINPKSAQGIFSAIKKALLNENFIELSAASEDELLEKRPAEEFIIVGKSAGGRIALEHQIKHKDAKALVLLAPAAEPSPKYREINVPALIIHGTADDVIPLENSKKLQRILPDAKQVVIEGADHSYRGKKKEVADAVEKWLKRIKFEK